MEGNTINENVKEVNGNFEFDKRNGEPNIELKYQEEKGNVSPKPLKISESTADVNILIIVALMLGRIMSKMLCFLEIFLGWFLLTILEQRNNKMDNDTIWKFIIIDDDNDLLAVRSKLYKMSIVMGYNIIYGFIFLLWIFIRILLSASPKYLLKFISFI